MSLVAKGSWDLYDGGKKSLNNPQFCLDIFKPAKVVICLSVPEKLPINIFVTKTSGVRFARRKQLNEAEIYGESRYAVAGESRLEVNLKPDPEGKSYIIVPCGGKGKTFTLTVESNPPDAVGMLEEIEEIGGPPKYKECDCEDILRRHRVVDDPMLMKTNPINEIIAHCRSHGCRFRDDAFPAGEKSLNELSHNRGSHTKLEGVVSWKRVDEFLGKPSLYVDGIDFSDVMQGGIGNCWLINTIATCCREEERIKGIIYPKETCSYGVYVVKLWLRDVEQDKDFWRYIVLDDKFPVNDKNQFFGVHSKDPNEFWVCLIEKAFAKVYGSYRMLKSGTMSFAAHDLTGGETKVICNASTSSDDLWKEMEVYDKNSWLLGGGCGVRSGKLVNEHGLVEGHAYSIISLHVVQGSRLVKLRNPWGHGEWKGSWSDGDKVHWTPQNKAKAGWKDADDGMFFMDLEDYKKHFDNTYFCKA